MFKSMKLSSKLSLGFALLTLVGAVIGIFGMIQIKTINDADTKLYKEMTVPLGELVLMVDNYQRMRVSLREVMLAKTTNDIQKNIDIFDKQSNEFDRIASSYKTTLIFEEGRQLFKKMETEKKEYVRMIRLIFDAWLAGDSLKAATIMYDDAHAPINALQETIETMMKSKTDFAKQIAEENTKLSNFSFLIMTICHLQLLFSVSHKENISENALS